MNWRLFLILPMLLSCSESVPIGNKPVIGGMVADSKSDTLTFSSGVRAVFQDSKGNYWFGSNNEGVSFYDGKKFTYFTMENGLADNQVRSIQEDESGSVWLETVKGVSVYSNGMLSNCPIYDNRPIVDWNEVEGDLWFYSSDEVGVYRFDGTRMNHLVFPKLKNDNSSKFYGVTDISKGKDDAMWIATYSAIFNYNGKAMSVFDDSNLELAHGEELHVRSILSDSKGRVWIGNNGIGVLLMEGGSLTHFSKQHGKLLPIKDFVSNTKSGQFTKNTGLQSVFAIEEDGEGNIWFGDRDTGAWKFDGTTLTNYKVDSSLNSPMIWCIYKDQNKNLFFGMANGGVYRFNGTSFDRQF